MLWSEEFCVGLAYGEAAYWFYIFITEETKKKIEKHRKQETALCAALRGALLLEEWGCSGGYWWGCKCQQHVVQV